MLNELALRIAVFKWLMVILYRMHDPLMCKLNTY